MKIRTDYVTNSSSSSFIVQVKIKTYDGRVFGWKAGANEEGGYYYNSLTVLRSPAELAKVSSIDELIDMLNDSIKNNYWDEDDPGESADAGDEIYGLESISMNDIKRIEITGNRRGSEDYYRSFVFDKETNEYFVDVYGYDYEINGGSGGDLVFDDESKAKVHKLSNIHENINYIENGKLFINARDNYGDFTDLFIGREMDFLEFDKELEEFDEIVIGEKVEYISPDIFMSIGDYTGSYERFIVSDKNKRFSAINGWLYSKDGKTLYQIPPKKVLDGLRINHGEIIESNAVIASDDFEDTTIYLEEGVKELRIQSIVISGNLTIYIPGSVYRIDDCAIDGYDELTIIAPNNFYAQKRAEELKTSHEPYEIEDFDDEYEDEEE